MLFLILFLVLYARAEEDSEYELSVEDLGYLDVLLDEVKECMPGHRPTSPPDDGEEPDYREIEFRSGSESKRNEKIRQQVPNRRPYSKRTHNQRNQRQRNSNQGTYSRETQWSSGQRSQTMDKAIAKERNKRSSVGSDSSENKRIARKKLIN